MGGEVGGASCLQEVGVARVRGAEPGPSLGEPADVAWDLLVSR